VTVGFLTVALLAFGTSPLAASGATTVAKQVAAARKMLNSLKLTNISTVAYSRTAQFGSAWLDVDNNHCDTRNDILKRDLSGEVFSGSCKVLTGNLRDPYTGKTIHFKRGVSTSTAVQIDHVIPLHLVWQLGASKWTKGKRVAIANDPLNLLAVDGPTNNKKSDSGPDAWLPPVKSYRCTYIIRFVRIAYLYQLGITSAIKKAINTNLNTCKVIVGQPATMSPLSRASWVRAEAIS